MASTYSDLLGYEKQATGENSATWGDVLNTTLELLEDSIAGSLSKSVAGSSDVTLTDLDGAIDEHRKMVMEFTGTLTGNINVIVPATSKLYFIHNNTSGAFTLTVKPSAGTGIAVTQGSKDILIADGTNVVRAIDVSSYTHPNHSGDVTSSGDGATTIVNDAVTTAKIINDAVSLAKMAAGTTGEVITYDGSGNPATLAVGTSGHYLKTNGAGNLPTWEALSVNGLEINVSATGNLGLGTGAVDSITTGTHNVGLGDDAGTAITTGHTNTAIGRDSLKTNTSGSYNTAVGTASLEANTTASYNTAVGKEALKLNTTGANNTANGYNALYSNTTGTENVAVGKSALNLNTTGGYSTAIGTGALASNSTGIYNTAVGRDSLNLNTVGGSNVALGKNAGNNITTGSSNIIIGADISAPSATASNQLNIGGWITGAAGAIAIAGAPEWSRLNVQSPANDHAMSVHVTTSSYHAINFWNSSQTLSGSIAVTGSTTSYNTSSDYRLKENVVPMTGSIDRLKNLNPSNFNFIGDANTVDGFLAHEAQAVVPEAVNGVKDGVTDMGDVTDAEGVTVNENVTEPAELEEGQVWTKTGDTPNYQGIDQSKLVPLLVASLQEAIARIEVLENA